MRYLHCTSGGNLMPSKTSQSIHLNSSLPVFWQKNRFVPHSSVMAAECLWKLPRLTSLCTYWHQECRLCLFPALQHLPDNPYRCIFSTPSAGLPLSLLFDHTERTVSFQLRLDLRKTISRSAAFKIVSIMEIWQVYGWLPQLKITACVSRGNRVLKILLYFKDHGEKKGCTWMKKNCLTHLKIKCIYSFIYSALAILLWPGQSHGEPPPPPA